LDPDEVKEFNELIAREIQADLTDAEGPTGYDFTPWAHRFPEWTWLQRRERCDTVLPELALMVADGYEHDLSALHEFTLFRSLQDWREVAEDRASDAVTEQVQQEHNDHLELLEYFLSEAFEDEDFLTVHVFANAALRGGDLNKEFGVAIEDFFELMPADIRQSIEQMLTARASRGTPSPGGQDSTDPEQQGSD